MRKYVLLNNAQFSKLKEMEPSITYALCHKDQQRRFTEVDIKYTIRNIFNKPYVELFDKDNETAILFTKDEWLNFVSLLPCISRYIEQLTCVEPYLIEHIDRVMRSDSVYVPPPQQVNGWDADRLHDEIVWYKKTKPTAG